jgi:serine/threonine protein kinase
MLGRQVKAQHDALEKLRERNKKLREELGKDFLGGGMYGWVIRKRTPHGQEVAIKCFDRLDYLIQEWSAIKRIEGCRYLIQAHKVDLDRMEITMDLYDSSLDHWISKNTKASIEEKMAILKQVLLGVQEISERNLTHGDLKPDNILVKKDKSGKTLVVISDCGFMSVNKYSRTHLTAPSYQEPAHSNHPDPFKNFHHHPGHDMYSYGLIFAGILIGSPIVRPYDCDHNMLSFIVEKELKLHGYGKYVEYVLSMLNPDIEKRWSASEALYHIFGHLVSVGPDSYRSISCYSHKEARSSDDKSHKPERSHLPGQSRERKHQIKHEIMKYNLVLHRCYIGYKALCHHLYSHCVAPEKDIRYVEALIIILYSLFRTKEPPPQYSNGKNDGKGRLFVTKRPTWASLSININNVIGILSNLLEDEVFISILLQKSCSE